MKTETQILVDKALRSMRLARLDLAIACGAAAADDSPVTTMLCGLADPVGEAVRVLDVVARRLEEPEASYPPFTICSK